MGLAEAALEGARLRLRPILMTSFAFILGCVPLWTASGAGSVGRQIMGTTVIGGMLAVSAIGIFLIPAIFYVVEKLSGRESAGPEPGARRRRRETEHEILSDIAIAVAAGLLSRLRRGPELRAPHSRRARELPRAGAAARRRRPRRSRTSSGSRSSKTNKLQELTRTALVQNYDLRDAVARVEQARANLGITRSNQFPQVSASGDVRIHAPLARRPAAAARRRSCRARIATGDRRR